MSHRKPSKTEFQDEWRDDAACPKAVAVEPGLRTAWDNIDTNTDYTVNTHTGYIADPMAEVARQICFSCPVRNSCILDALWDNEAEGIRGGYRFEGGYVSTDDARKIKQEFGITARVRKSTGPNENQTLSELQSNE